MGDNPFTEEEQEIINAMVAAHNKFVTLIQTHPNDMEIWVDGIHKCESVLQSRILRRDYPEVFQTITDKEEE